MISIAKAWGMTAGQHDELAEQVRRDGHCVLPGLFPKALINEWAQRFEPLLKDHIAREGHRQNRGTGRYYVTLPFVAPFADPFVFADPDILAVVDRLVGPGTVMCQLATDTPLRGSDYQELHRDAPPLFPEWGRETPPFQLAVNFPLVDVTLDNGPLETTRGTHLLAKDEALARIHEGEIALEPITMNAGDVMIRDVRAIHRGTPNRTDTPRPMVVIGYSRRWLHRPEVSIKIPRATWDNLPEDIRGLLRFNPVVERLDQESEVYQSFAY
jgi:hypothetical protein